MKKSAVYSQGLRIKRLCSEETFLTNHLKNLRSAWLCNRCCPDSMVEEKLTRVANKTRDELLYTICCVSKRVGVRLIVTNHPHLNGSNKIMRKNLQTDQIVKLVFTIASLVSFHIAYNLRSHLDWSKLYPVQRTTGSCKCNTPRFQVDKNVKECSEVSSHETKETSKLNHYFHCYSNSLIYLISCKVCGKRYVECTKLIETSTLCKSIFMNNF